MARAVAKIINIAFERFIKFLKKTEVIDERCNENFRKRRSQ